MTSLIPKPRSLAKTSSGLRTRLHLTSKSPTPQPDIQERQLTHTLRIDISTLAQLFMDILVHRPFFRSFALFVADYHCFMWRYPFRQKHGHYSLLDFYRLWLQAFKLWIDHNPVFSCPSAKNLMPTRSWAVFALLRLLSSTFLFYFVLFLQISISIRLFRSGERPKYIWVSNLHFIFKPPHHTMAYTSIDHVLL